MKSKRVVLWIEMQGFYAWRFGVTDRALLVTRDRVVLDVNPLARETRVSPGMPLRQAKSVVHDILVKKWLAEEYEERQREWLDVCASYTGVIEPVDQHIAALDLSLHPNVFDITERVIGELAVLTGLPMRYGLGPSKWLAQLASRHRSLSGALDDLEEFLDPLPMRQLLLATPEQRQRLEFLGYPTIGSARAIPENVLQRQFGAEGRQIFQAVRGRIADPVKALYPHGEVRAYLTFDGEVESLETVDNGLVSLAAELGKRLGERGEFSSEVHAEVEFAEGPPLEAKRRFTKPITHERAVLIALRLMLTGKIGQAVTALRVRLSDLAKLRVKQPSLEGSGERPTIDPALKYVHTVFGEESLRRANQIEVARRARVLKEWQRATGWH